MEICFNIAEAPARKADTMRIDSWAILNFFTNETMFVIYTKLSKNISTYRKRKFKDFQRGNPLLII